MTEQLTHSREVLSREIKCNDFFKAQTHTHIHTHTALPLWALGNNLDPTSFGRNQAAFSSTKSKRLAWPKNTLRGPFSSDPAGLHAVL